MIHVISYIVLLLFNMGITRHLTKNNNKEKKKKNKHKQKTQNQKPKQTNKQTNNCNKKCTKPYLWCKSMYIQDWVQGMLWAS